MLTYLFIEHISNIYGIYKYIFRNLIKILFDQCC